MTMLTRRHLLAAPCSFSRLLADDNTAAPTPSRCHGATRSAPAAPTTEPNGRFEIDLVHPAMGTGRRGLLGGRRRRRCTGAAARGGRGGDAGEVEKDILREEEQPEVRQRQ
jgi:hypothetical protein